MLTLHCHWPFAFLLVCFSLEAASCASQNSSDFSACRTMPVLMGTFRAFAVPCMSWEPLAVNVLCLCKRSVCDLSSLRPLQLCQALVFLFYFVSFACEEAKKKKRKEQAVLPKLAPPPTLFTKCCEILIGNLSGGQTVLGGEKKKNRKCDHVWFRIEVFVFHCLFCNKGCPGLF